MIKQIIAKQLFYPFGLFLLGLTIIMVQSSATKNYENNNWLILLPIILPLAGIYFGVKSILKAKGYAKLIPLVSILANLGLAIIIFIAYSFSYWEF